MIVLLFAKLINTPLESVSGLIIRIVANVIQTLQKMTVEVDIGDPVSFFGSLKNSRDQSKLQEFAEQKLKPVSYSFIFSNIR